VPDIALATPSEAPAATPALAPYVGVRPYRREERDWFFGRDDDARFLCDKVLAARLTILYSQSGLGKSSLLHARVIPQLEESGGLVIYFDAWSQEHPIAALKQALSDVASSLGVASPSAGAPTLLELVQLIAMAERRVPVLVLDQFEEFLTTHGQQLDPLRKELAALVRTSRVEVQILLSLREEFLGALEPFRSLILTLFQSTYRLEPLDDARVGDAIRLPAERFQGSVEPALVTTLIADLKTSVDLPMLQLVCEQLWERAPADRRLTLAAYRSLGGAQSVIGRYVSDAMPRRWRDQLQTARMMQLLAPPSGLKMSFSASDLAAHLGITVDRIAAELERLSDARILRTRKYAGGVRYELQHDAFIRVVAPWRDQVLLRAARLKRYGRALTAVAVVAIPLAWMWYVSWDAERKNLLSQRAAQRRDLARDLARESGTALQSRPARALLLAAVAEKIAPPADVEVRAEGQAALRLALSSVGGQAFRVDGDAHIATLVAGGDEPWLLAGAGDRLLVWDARRPLTMPQSRATGAIRRSAVSADGRWYAVASDGDVSVGRLGDGSLALSPLPVWGADVATPADGHRISAIALSPSGDRLAVGIDGVGVQLWQLAPAPTRITLAPPASFPNVAIFALTFDEGGLLAATSPAVGEAGSDRSRVFRWRSAAPAVRPSVLWDGAPENCCLDMAFGEQGKWLAVQELTNDVSLWELRSGASARPIPLPSSRENAGGTFIRAMTLSPQGPLLAMAIASTVEVWNIRTGQSLHLLRGHEAPVTILAFGGSSRWLASAAADGARLWEVGQARADPLVFTAATTHDRLDVGFWPSGRYLLTGDERGTMRRLALDRSERDEQLSPGSPDAAYFKVRVVSPSGRWLAAGNERGDLYLWERPFQPGGRVLHVRRFAEEVAALAFSADERWLAAGSVDKTAAVWPLDGGLGAPQGLTHLGSVECLTFSSDSRWLASGSALGDVARWDLHRGATREMLAQSRSAAIKGLGFSPDSRLLAAADSSAAIRIWDMAAPGAPRAFANPGETLTSLNAIAFSGQHVAVAATDGGVLFSNFWGSPSVSRIGGNQALRVVAFSPDGTRLATGASSGAVTLLDLDNPTRLHPLPAGPGRPVTRLAFTHDSRMLAASGGDATFVWTVQARDLHELACRTAGRTSLEDERCAEATRLELSCVICNGREVIR
jgi:WD40 repeat protein